MSHQTFHLLFYTLLRVEGLDCQYYCAYGYQALPLFPESSNQG